MGFPSYADIALLTITGSLNTALDLNDFLSCLIDDLWASELTVSNFSPTDRILQMVNVYPIIFQSRVHRHATCLPMFEWSSHSNHQSVGDRLYSYPIEYLKPSEVIAKSGM
ncbi:hypothetical protein Tco_0684481 [Tanacetum coccineum]